MAAMYFYIYVCVCIQCVCAVGFWDFFAVSKVRIKGVTGLLFATTTAKFQGALCLKWPPTEDKSDTDTRATPFFIGHLSTQSY